MKITISKVDKQPKKRKPIQHSKRHRIRQVLCTEEDGKSVLVKALNRLTTEPKYKHFIQLQSEELLAEILNAMVQIFYRRGKQKSPVPTTKEALVVAMELLGFTPAEDFVIDKSGTDTNMVVFQNKRERTL